MTAPTKKLSPAKTVYALASRLSRADATLVAAATAAAVDSLLARWTDAARRHGVPNRGVIAWVRRKIGPDVTVLRVRRDGTLGCATPCILCQRALAAFDMRVSCPPGAAGGGWFSGRLNADDAPPPTLTSGQRRQLGVPADPRKPVGVPGPSRYDGGGRYDGNYPRKPRGPAQPVARLGSDAPAVVAAAASSGSKGKGSPSGPRSPSPPPSPPSPPPGRRRRRGRGG